MASTTQRLPNLHVSWGTTSISNLITPRIPDVLVPKPDDCPYRQKMFRYVWSKHRLPLLSSQDVVKVDITEIGGKKSTPYRLPRIDPEIPGRYLEESICTSRVMWGQYGFEDAIRIPELIPDVKQPSINHPSKPLGAQYRHSGSNIPSFRNAAITPRIKPKSETTYCSVANTPLAKTLLKNEPLNRESSDMPDYYHHIRKTDSGEGIIPPGPTPTPISRSFSPTKSVKSIHWALGSTQTPLFDKKGRGRVQGPYSREFTVTCGAPNNWLKMRLGGTRVVS
ncbi:hypothetical protein LOTGIDRAFT_234771 [Lottia gigantea]|uniref:Uncharacterized protein n=1 Tax=Lottia gigantea TaxID=225164 RepID=V3ZUF3_LOTGI|nr:hypothetical protein LOTGIDRAFT_234771 [Lottia gigantea]ESO87987.1 hypothetical protein LOTGIDRAFT_234771 [Lottia gigantea]